MKIICKHERPQPPRQILTDKIEDDSDDENPLAKERRKKIEK